MDIIALLQWQVFGLLGQRVTLLEVVGFITGALCVWAVGRRWTWNWPVGIANNLAFLVLFLNAGLYADSALQIAFIVLGVIGWASWSHGGRDEDTGRVEIRHVAVRESLLASALVAAGTVAVALLLDFATDSVVPWPDAFILAASLVATWLQARRVIEHWYLWIVIDVASVPLYLYKGLALTAILYLGFLVLCAVGVVSWRRRLVTPREEAPVLSEITS